MKNNTFNGARLGALTRKYFSDSRDWLVGATLSLLVLILLAYLPTLTGLLSPEYALIFLSMLMVGALIGVTFNSVRGYVGRKTGIMNAMVPASTFEKYLVAWGVSFPAAVTLMVLATWGINTVLHHTTGIYITDKMFFDVENPSGAEIWKGIRNYLLTAASTHAIVFWGVLTFFASENIGRKALVGAIAATVCVVLINGLPHWIGLPEYARVGFPFFFEIRLNEVSDGARILQTIGWAPASIAGLLRAVVSWSIPVVFWVAGYSKLKELQVR
jgi:hypothetical protein